MTRDTPKAKFYTLLKRSIRNKRSDQSEKTQAKLEALDDQPLPAWWHSRFIEVR